MRVFRAFLVHGIDGIDQSQITCFGLVGHIVNVQIQFRFAIRPNRHAQNIVVDGRLVVVDLLQCIVQLTTVNRIFATSLNLTIGHIGDGGAIGAAFQSNAAFVHRAVSIFIVLHATIDGGTNAVVDVINRSV